MSNTSIGGIVIDLAANVAGFRSDLNNAFSAVQDVTKKIKEVFEGVGVGLSFTGLADLVDRTIEFGNELSKAAQKTGIGAEQISALAYAGRTAGIDLGQLSDALTRMEKAVSSAGTGSVKANTTIQALGLTFQQIKNLSPDQQFELFAQRINELASPADKARAAVELFGKAGADLLPLFSQGAEGIEKAKEEAGLLGQALTADQLKTLKDAKDAIDRLKESFVGLATAATAAISGPLAKTFDSITNVVTGNKIGILTGEIADLQDRLFNANVDNAVGTPGIKILRDQLDRAELTLQALKSAEAIKKQLSGGNIADLLPGNAPGYQADIEPINTNILQKINDPLKQFYDNLDSETQSGEEKIQTAKAKLEVQLDELFDDLDINITQYWNRLESSDDKRNLADLMTVNKTAIDQFIKESGEAQKAIFASQSESAKLAADNTREYYQKMEGYAKSAADGIESAFADFLLNPFEGGLKKMLSSWVELLAQMEAKAAAAQLFKYLFPDTGGFAGVLSGLIGGVSSGGGGAAFFPANPDLPTYATGGSFKVGGVGGTDSQVVAFRASPDEHVTISTPGQRSIGASSVIHFSPVYNIGSGVSRTDVIQACAATQQATIARMTELIRGGAYR